MSAPSNLSRLATKILDATSSSGASTRVFTPYTTAGRARPIHESSTLMMPLLMPVIRSTKYPSRQVFDSQTGSVTSHSNPTFCRHSSAAGEFRAVRNKSRSLVYRQIPVGQPHPLRGLGRLQYVPKQLN